MGLRFVALIAFFFCCWKTQSFAQIQGDTLKGVQINAASQADDPRVRFLPGARNQGIDSATLSQYKQQPLSVLLEQKTSVFIKSFGFNSLATLSLRGASAAQSAVFWQGVPLMNASTGVTDLSLIPLAFSDSVSLQYGSSGALGGSGQVGGAVLLQNRAPQFHVQPHFSFEGSAGVGSFGNFPFSAAAGLSTRRFAINLRGMAVSAENDFPYTDANGHSQRMPNASLSGWGFLADASWKVSEKDLISFHGWQQAFEREIPPALFETYSVKKQNDEATRLMIEWQHDGVRLDHYSRFAFLSDGYQYQDSTVHLNNTSRTEHFYAEWGAQGSWGRGWQWLLFTPIQYMKLEGRPEDQIRAAIAGSLLKSLMSDRIEISGSGRLELFNDCWIFLPGLSSSWKPSQEWTVRSSVQRSYRMPSLNELYYKPGGNPDLKPENGWSLEGGYTYNKTWSSALRLQHSVDAYTRWINDWIIWLGGAIWTPHNLAAVHSRGLQTDNELIWKPGEVSLKAGFSIAYTRATPTESYLPNDQSIGKQIPYTPEWTGSASIGLNWKGWSVNYAHRFNGVRYITVDESDWLDPYSIGSLIVSYSFGTRGKSFQIQSVIQNIWNNKYYVVAYRPMPGGNYLLNLSVKLN